MTLDFAKEALKKDDKSNMIEFNRSHMEEEFKEVLQDLKDKPFEDFAKEAIDICNKDEQIERLSKFLDEKNNEIFNLKVKIQKLRDVDINFTKDELFLIEERCDIETSLVLSKYFEIIKIPRNNIDGKVMMMLDKYATELIQTYEMLRTIRNKLEEKRK
jgi:hypothetical protein